MKRWLSDDGSRDVEVNGGRTALYEEESIDGLLSNDGFRDAESIEGLLSLLSGLEKLKADLMCREPLIECSEFSEGERP